MVLQIFHYYSQLSPEHFFRLSRSDVFHILPFRNSCMFVLHLHSDILDLKHKIIMIMMSEIKVIKLMLDIKSRAIRFTSYLSFSHRRKIYWHDYNILYTIVHSLHYFEWTSAVVHFSSTLTHIPFLDGHLRYSTSSESLLLLPTMSQRHYNVFRLGDN